MNRWQIKGKSCILGWLHHVEEDILPPFTGHDGTLNDWWAWIWCESYTMTLWATLLSPCVNMRSGFDLEQCQMTSHHCCPSLHNLSIKAAARTRTRTHTLQTAGFRCHLVQQHVDKHDLWLCLPSNKRQYTHNLQSDTHTQVDNNRDKWWSIASSLYLYRAR